jgi:uncharacterized protein (DUF433 family)
MEIRHKKGLEGTLTSKMQQAERSASLGRGVYTGREAARLSMLRSERITPWVRGYSYTIGSGAKSSSPPIFAADRSNDGPLSLSFLDLVEILFVRAFLAQGVSMRTIRCAATEGARIFDVKHPFCLKRFETDGRGIFAQVAKDAGDEAIVNLVSSQTVFPRVIRPLFKQIEYDVVTELASVWWPRGREVPVVLDPARAFGTPIVAQRGVPTHVLAGPVEAGDSPELVAKWFEVPVAEVRAAVEFERSLLAA